MTKLVLAGAALLVTACSGSAEQAPIVVTKPAVVDRAPIAALQTRDRTVRIYGGRDLRVTVVDDRGQLVASDVTMEQLRAIDPLLYRMCTNAVAGRGDIDARVYEHDIAPVTTGDLH